MEKLGFSLFPVAVPTRVTWARSGGRHFPFSSRDNTEEGIGWKKQGTHSEITENELGLKGYYPQSVESYIPDLHKNIPIVRSNLSEHR